MPLLDISYVTQTMLTLLREGIDDSPAWTSMQQPVVLPEPPVRVPTNGLGFYLYHISENSHYKNLPPPRLGDPPIRFSPMALNLHYQLSAFNDESNGTAPIQEQLLMGTAMKVLHDFPEITDTTMINGVQIMHTVIRGRTNDFKISMLPVTHNESVHFWTAGDSAMRLAAYYELSVVLLDPEESQRRTARVTSFGLSVFAVGAPKIFSSRSQMSFPAPPGFVGIRNIRLSPAQASPNSLTEESVVILNGAGMIGDQVEVLLSHADWPSSIPIDSSWNIESTGERLTFTVQETIPLQDGGTQDIQPGIYGAQVRVTKSSNGNQVSLLSNQCPISIIPRIDNIDDTLSPLYTVSGYFDPTAGFGLQTEVLLGDMPLQRVTMGPLAPGQFMVNATIQFELPAGLNTGDVFPLRIIIEGVESAPRWMQIP